MKNNIYFESHDHDHEQDGDHDDRFERQERISSGLKILLVGMIIGYVLGGLTVWLGGLFIR